MTGEPALEAAARTYLDGLYEGDVEKLARVFHPTCALTFEQDGQLTVWPREAWFEMVQNRVSPQRRGLPRHDEIVLVYQASPTTALVKLKCAVPPRFFTDYLSFLKLEGHWQVVQKVFAVEVRE